MAKRLMTVFLVIVLAVCMSSCSDSSKNAGDDPDSTSKTQAETPSKGGVLSLCMFEVDSLNPLATKNESNIEVLRLMFDGLFNVKQDFSLENNLCESYTISEDGLSYSFKIRDGVTFHDGSLLTAEDVDASFKLISEAKSPYLLRYDNVDSSGATDMTWNVRLNAPVINFPATLDFPIVPARDANLGTSIRNISYIPNGTGIYKVDNYKETKELMLCVNEKHFSGKKPNIPEVKITFVSDRQTAVSMFENLQVDILSESVVSPDEYTPKRELITQVAYPKNELTFLGINNQKPILISPAVRQAISLCIDKGTIASNTKTRVATPVDIPINPHSCYYTGDNEAIPYDTVKANAILAEDGFNDTDSNGILEKEIYGEMQLLAVDILVNSENNARIRMAEAIKAALENAGFAVTITSVDFDTYNSRIAARYYDLFIGSISFSQNNDLSFMLNTDKNMFGISNEKIDACLEELRVLSNSSAILNVYSDLCNILYESMPVSGIYYDNGVLLCDKKLRGNIAPAESNIFINVHEWFIKD